jgi:hypothetical protein
MPLLTIGTEADEHTNDLAMRIVEDLQNVDVDSVIALKVLELAHAFYMSALCPACRAAYAAQLGHDIPVMVEDATELARSAGGEKSCGHH